VSLESQLKVNNLSIMAADFFCLLSCNKAEICLIQTN